MRKKEIEQTSVKALGGMMMDPYKNQDIKSITDRIESLGNLAMNCNSILTGMPPNPNQNRDEINYEKKIVQYI